MNGGSRRRQGALGGAAALVLLMLGASVATAASPRARVSEHAAKLKDPDPAVRQQAGEGLVDVLCGGSLPSAEHRAALLAGAAEVIPAAAKKLAAADVRARKCGVQALGLAGGAAPKPALKALTKAMDDADKSVVLAVADALDEIDARLATEGEASALDEPPLTPARCVARRPKKVGGSKQGVEWRCAGGGSWREAGRWRSGRREGVWVEFYENTKPPIKRAEGRYVNGLREGVWTHWYKTGGKRKQGPHKSGQPDGVFEFWRSSGKLQARGRLKGKKKQCGFEYWNEKGEPDRYSTAAKALQAAASKAGLSCAPKDPCKWTFEDFAGLVDLKNKKVFEALVIHLVGIGRRAGDSGIWQAEPPNGVKQGIEGANALYGHARRFWGADRRDLAALMLVAVKRMNAESISQNAQMLGYGGSAMTSEIANIVQRHLQLQEGLIQIFDKLRKEKSADKTVVKRKQLVYKLGGVTAGWMKKAKKQLAKLRKKQKGR